MLTRLEAVNIILDSVGESAVNSLESGLVDAEVAERALDQVVDQVLAKGWHINTERNWKLVPNSNKEIVLPHNVLKVDSVGPSQHLNVVARKDGTYWKLYNVKDQTFTFDGPVYVDYSYSLDFESLPHNYQIYVVVQAAELYQQRVFGSVVLDQFLRTQRDEAWAAMLDEEAENEDHNVLRDSASVREIAWRNNRRALR